MALLSGITDIEIVAGPDGLMAYTATRGGGGILALRIGTQITLADQQFVETGSRLPVAADLNLVTLGGTLTALVTGTSQARSFGYRIESDGSLGTIIESRDSLPGVIAAQCVARVAGSDYLISSRVDDGSLYVHRVNSTGTQTQVSSLPLGLGGTGADLCGVMAMQVGAQPIILALSQTQHQVLAFRLTDAGVLEPAEQFGAVQGLGINGLSALSSIEAFGESFAIVAARGSSSLSVFAVSATGGLALRDHVIDSLDTRFSGVQAVATVMVGDRAFVVAGGGDDGVNLFALLPGGRMVLVATGLGGPGLALSNITALAAIEQNGQIEVFVTGEGAGLTRLRLDPGPLAPAQLGTALADSLTGGAAGDLLNGGAGADVLQAGEGSDILIDGTGTDSLFGGAGADVFVLVADGVDDHVRDFQVGIDRIDLTAWGRIYDLSALVWQVTSTGAVISYGAERILITTGNGQPLQQSALRTQDFVWLWHDMPLIIPFDPQSLLGTPDRDVQTGSNGADRFTGSAGADTLDGQAGMDVVDYSLDPGSGLVIDMDQPLSGTGWAAGDSFTDIEGIVAGAGNDTIRGSFGSEMLDGGAGNDLILGRDGADQLIGGAGDDTLSGGAVADRLEGGLGRDMASYAQALAGVVASLRSLGGTAGEAAGDTYASIEDMEGSAFADTLTGDAGTNALFGGGGNDIIAGREGNDTLHGGAGADYLDGGDGIDLADYSRSAGAVLVDLADLALNTGDAAGDSFVFVEGVQGGGGDDILRGTAGADRLLGGAGNDTIIGRGGADTLDGGLGWDVLIFGDASAGVSVTLGPDPGSGAQSLGPLLSGFEGLEGTRFADQLSGDGGGNHLSGADGADDLSGRGGTDTLSGGAGNDTLRGGQGADLLEGDEGEDWASYSDASAAIRLDLSRSTGNSGDAAGDRFTAIEAFSGSAHDDDMRGDITADLLAGGEGDDHLMGRAGDDSLRGDAGNDRLSGGQGADILQGGAGLDIALYDKARSAIRVDLDAPDANRGEARGDQLTGIEGLVGSRFDDSLSGTAGAETLWGGAGNDLLEGRNGDDVLIGGAGADTLMGGQGLDTADFSRDTAALLLWLDATAAPETGAGQDSLADIEIIIGTRFSDTVYGAAADEQLFGGRGRDRLYGGEGADLLSGGRRADRLFGDTGQDTLEGGTGSDRADYAAATRALRIDLQFSNLNSGFAAGDTLIFVENLTGGEFDDVLAGDGQRNALKGGRGNDLLQGRDGNDRLSGGRGDDTLEGGAGDDRLAGSGGNDVFLFSGGQDVIRGYRSADDRIGIDDALCDAAGLALALAGAVQDGNALILTFAPGAVLRIEGVGATPLSGDDIFLF